MKKGLIITVGVVGVFVGMGFVLPAVAQWRMEGAMTSTSVVLCFLGTALTLGGIGTTVAAAKRRA